MVIGYNRDDKTLLQYNSRFGKNGIDHLTASCT
jgi:hypothetical protein